MSNFISLFIDLDKQHTFTHCRYEVKSVYNIDNVIIADSDEFLYCPPADTTSSAVTSKNATKRTNTAMEQQKSIHNLIQSQKLLGIEQITFNQLILSNRTDSIRDCIINNSYIGESILKCYSSYQYKLGLNSMKSLHIGHNCPLTGSYSSCPYHNTSALSHDCLCISEKSNTCSLIHLTTNIWQYYHFHQPFNQSTKDLIAKENNELYEISQSVSTV